MRPPGIRATFDDEGASVCGVTVMMRVHRTAIRPDEGLGQHVEGTVSAKPGEVICEMLGCRAEGGFILPTHKRIQAIGSHNQIGIKPLGVGHLPPMLNAHTQIGSTRLENLEQLQSADSTETYSIKRHLPCRKVQSHILPGFQMRYQKVVDFRVVIREEIQRLVRKHHAETERRAMYIPLEHAHLGIRKMPACQNRRVQSTGTSANDVYLKRAYGVFHLSGTLLLQSEPLDFSGLSLWKGVCEDNRSRIFVRRDGCLDVVLKGLGKLFALFMAFSHHNMRLDNGAALFI